MAVEPEASEELLAPLLGVLPAGPARLVARPHAVAVDRVEGASVEAIGWPEELHRRAAEWVGAGRRLSGGVIARLVGDTLLLRQPAAAPARLAALVHEGRLSSLAARLLGASLELGRNLLLVGGDLAGEELAAALAADGRRPVVAGDALSPAPSGWPWVDGAAGAAAIAADRVLAWELEPRRLVELFVGGRAVIACSADRRLDRALMRFELAAEQLGGRGSSPLCVLAGLDLIVVLGQGGRVNEIAGIELAEDGYRPRLLFATGVPPVRTALVPVGVPSFLDELGAAGHTVLVEELRHAAPQSEPALGRAAPAAGAEEPRRGRAPAPGLDQPEPRPGSVLPLVEPPAPRLDPALADAPPPGWELDQLGEEVVGVEVPSGGAESATLAASFGLGPPPAPPGVTPITADGGGDGSGFAEALRRARERDAELGDRAAALDAPGVDAGPSDDER